ncbi:MAG: fatty acid desaturase [Pseudomonadota bacterium]
MTDLVALEKDANAAARARMGEFAWPTVVLGVVVVSAYVATIWLTISGALPLWGAFILATLCVYAVYTVLHDSVHGSINGKNKSLQWLNDLMGYAAGQVMGISYQAHKKEHLAHHRHTNEPGKDPDLLFAGGGAWSVFSGSLKALPVQYSYFFQHAWANAKPRERAIVLIELTLIVASRLALVAAGFWLESLVIFIASGIVGLMLLVILFAWSVHYPHNETGRYQDTTILLVPKWLETPGTWAWLYQNYHAVHHLFPRVPFYRYREVYRDIKPIMEANGAPTRVIGKGLVEPRPIQRAKPA